MSHCYQPLPLKAAASNLPATLSRRCCPFSHVKLTGDPLQVTLSGRRADDPRKLRLRLHLGAPSPPAPLRLSPASASEAPDDSALQLALLTPSPPLTISFVRCRWTTAGSSATAPLTRTSTPPSPPAQSVTAAAASVGPCLYYDICTKNGSPGFYQFFS